MLDGLAQDVLQALRELPKSLICAFEPIGALPSGCSAEYQPALVPMYKDNK